MSQRGGDSGDLRSSGRVENMLTRKVLVFTNQGDPWNPRQLIEQP